MLVYAKKESIEHYYEVELVLMEELSVFLLLHSFLYQRIANFLQIGIHSQ